MSPIGEEAERAELAMKPFCELGDTSHVDRSPEERATACDDSGATQTWHNSRGVNYSERAERAMRSGVTPGKHSKNSSFLLYDFHRQLLSFSPTPLDYLVALLNFFCKLWVQL